MKWMKRISSNGKYIIDGIKLQLSVSLINFKDKVFDYLKYFLYNQWIVGKIDVSNQTFRNAMKRVGNMLEKKM